MRRTLGIALVLCCSASAASAAPLVDDAFDRDNAEGAAPAGWSVLAPAGASAAIAESAAPRSAPFGVELVDDAAVGRPEIKRALAATAAGSATVQFRVDA